MIKPSELRIGNLIVTTHEPGKPIWQILEIREKGIIFGKSWETGTAYCQFEVADPIPLTPEWLERFGFSEREIIYNFEKSIKISIGEQKAYVGNLTSTSAAYISDVQYVHQLQNLYHALTGEELSITL